MQTTSSPIPTPVLTNVLALRNSHLRDSHLVFNEALHKYNITTDSNSIYTSVTTFIHQQFPHFDADDIINKMMKGRYWNSSHKYWGKSPEDIKKREINRDRHSSNPSHYRDNVWVKKI